MFGGRGPRGPAGPNPAVISTPFVAGDFTANGSMTWTVVTGNIISRYTISGKTLTWWLTITNTTIGGVLNNSLNIKIPGGYVAQPTTTYPYKPIIILLSDGLTMGNGMARVGDLDPSHVTLFRDVNKTNFTAGVWFNAWLYPIVIEVQ